MSSVIEYEQGSEDPDTELSWSDDDGVVSFSSGYTFTVKIGYPGETALVTKTSGITGADTIPNIVVSWTAGELDDLTAGEYVLRVIARKTATGKDRSRSVKFVYAPAVL